MLQHGLGGKFTLDELEEERNNWVAYNFPPSPEPFSDLTDNVLGVSEEAGELAHAVLKWKQGIRGTAEEHLAEILDAAGDILIYLTGVMVNARREAMRAGVPYKGITLQNAMEYAWAQVRNRDWQANKQDGGPT